MDGWCLSLIYGDFIRNCNLLNRGEEVNVQVNGTFAEYVKWLQTQDKEVGMEYYRGLLEGYENVAEIPSLGEDVSQEDIMQTAEFSLEKEQYDQIERYCKENDVTVNSVVETAIGILLQKYTRSKDAVYGKIVSGRNAEIKGIEGAVGLFINAIPVRANAEEHETCEALMKAVQRQNVEGTSYHYMPLVEIQSASGVGDGLIKVLFAFENYYIQEIDENDAKSLTFNLLSAREEQNYDMSFAAYIDDTLNISAEYRSRLYSAKEIKRILERLETTILQLVKTPQKKICDVNILTEEEKELVLREFNDTAADYPREKTVVDLFEEQVAKDPDRIALVFEDAEMTYGELNAKANQLARKLRGLGVQANDYVVLMANSSLEMIVGIYGILKSGAAYVPVDPNYPAERITFILEDCCPKCIVTAQAEVSVETEIPVMDITVLSKFAEATENLETVCRPEDQAYVIYTSGTTGQPKGVMIEHRSLNWYIRQFCETFNINEETVHLQHTYIGFDASVEEIYGALMQGGKMVIMARSSGIDLDQMLSLIETKGINLIGCVPVVANGLNAAGLKFTGQMLVGGAAVSYQQVDKLIANGAEVYNAYGPTEATVSVTYYRVDESCAQLTTVPIGRPVTNTQIYIMDGMNPCGIGVPGELCIAGDGVARGYLNRPELTAEKFIKNPFGEGRMYRSGDLARWLPDGNIEFMGRIDDQVKIRGFRIELGEIENVIRGSEGIKDAAVIVRSDDSGEKAIYAYMVSDEQIDLAELRKELRKKLPEYMIPAGMMQLEKLPLTPNGKLNKRALPEIEGTSVERIIKEPRTNLEKGVHKVFCEVLKTENISIDDNFFEVGGHSLRAVRLVNLLEELSGVRLKVKDIFDLKTVEDISAAIAQRDGSGYEAIPKAEEKESYIASPAQRRMYLVTQQEEDGITYNMPETFKAEKKLDIDRLTAALKVLVNRHEVLRTSFFMEGEEIRQRIEDIDFEPEVEEDLTGKTDEEIVDAFIRPFDLSKAPLFRAKIVDRGEYQLLLFDIHHIISDGGTDGILTSELIRLYKGETLPAVEKQYKDYSEWLATKDLSKQKEYWLNRFSDEIPVLDLPTDYAREQNMSHSGDFAERVSEEGLRNKVAAMARNLGTTEYSVLLSAFMILLARYTDEDESINVGTPFAGRNHPDLENMAGMFVNTIVLSGLPAEEKTVKDFIREIGDMFLQAVENQDYPFEELVDELGIQKDTARNPLFDVMFVLQNNEDSFDELEKAALAPILSDHRISKFDITLNVVAIENEYVFGMEYCDRLFKPYFIKGLLAGYEKTLCEVIDNIETCIEDIDTISDEEQEQILKQFSYAGD